MPCGKGKTLDDLLSCSEVLPGYGDCLTGEGAYQDLRMEVPEQGPGDSGDRTPNRNKRRSRKELNAQRVNTSWFQAKGSGADDFEAQLHSAGVRLLVAVLDADIALEHLTGHCEREVLGRTAERWVGAPSHSRH